MRQAGTKCSTWENSNLSKQKSHKHPSVIHHIPAWKQFPFPTSRPPCTRHNRLQASWMCPFHSAPLSQLLLPFSWRHPFSSSLLGFLCRLPDPAIYSPANVISCPPGRWMPSSPASKSLQYLIHIIYRAIINPAYLLPSPSRALLPWFLWKYSRYTIKVFPKANFMYALKTAWYFFPSEIIIAAKCKEPKCRKKNPFQLHLIGTPTIKVKTKDKVSPYTESKEAKDVAALSTHQIYWGYQLK